MDSIVIKQKIINVNNEVKDTSFEAKVNLKSEDEINSLLDAINDVRSILIRKKDKLNYLIDLLEGLTWYNADEIDKDDLREINDIIASSRDLNSIMSKDYSRFLAPLRQKGICREEIIEFKNTLEDFRAAYSDLESVFFFLPKDSEFLELTELLNEI